jgi:putative ABC transport system permease protein
VGTATLVALAVGHLPALQLSGHGLRDGLSRGSRRTAGRRDRTRGALVVTEVALALVLLVGAGLLLRSLERLFAVAPGFAPARLLTMQVQTSGRRFDDDARVYQFFREALDAVRAVPGVTAAAWTSALPLSGDGDTYGVHFESSPAGQGRTDGDVFRYAVSPGYFEAMGIPPVRGRYLAPSDGAGAPLAVVIHASFARQRFPGRDPIGQRLHVGPDSGPWYTIVGVVGDVKQLSLAAGQARAVYITTEQSWFADRALWLVVRARGDAAALAPAVKHAVWSVDRDQPVVRAATMDALIAASAAERRFALTLFGAFGVTALLLAAIGLYGVLAGSVGERVREIGVRAALGASRWTILRLVIGQGTALAAAGVVVGVGAAAAASDVVATLLFGVSRLDPLTYVGVVVLLLTTSALACALPAWRAARVDPAIALRAD